MPDKGLLPDRTHEPPKLRRNRFQAPENRRETGAPLRGSEAYRWKPGQSGNPGGRPKIAPLSQACRELLAQPVPGDQEGRTHAEAIAQMLAKKAIAGDIRAAQEIADRAEGKAHQSIEFQNTGLREAFERMTGEELKAYAETGQLPRWFTDHTERKDAQHN
jgi:Family of unknown function (DUF5681)